MGSNVVKERTLPLVGSLPGPNQTLGRVLLSGNQDLSRDLTADRVRALHERLAALHVVRFESGGGCTRLTYLDQLPPVVSYTSSSLHERLSRDAWETAPAHRGPRLCFAWALCSFGGVVDLRVREGGLLTICMTVTLGLVIFAYKR